MDKLKEAEGIQPNTIRLHGLSGAEEAKTTKHCLQKDLNHSLVGDC
jgi:hypothetical protein